MRKQNRLLILLLSVVFLAVTASNGAAAFFTGAHGHGHLAFVDLKHGVVHMVLGHDDSARHGHDSIDAGLDAISDISGHEHDHGHEAHLDDAVEPAFSAGKRLSGSAYALSGGRIPAGFRTPEAARQLHSTRDEGHNRGLLIKTVSELLI